MVGDSSTDCYEDGRRSHNKELPVIRMINDRSREVLDYRTYRLVAKLSHYDDEVATA